MNSPLIRRLLLDDLFPDVWGERYDGSFLSCIACGRATSKNGDSLGVIVTNGGSSIVHPEDLDADYAADPGGGMGWFPVGRECIKRVPAEFRLPNPYEDKAAGV